MQVPPCQLHVVSRVLVRMQVPTVLGSRGVEGVGEDAVPTVSASRGVEGVGEDAGPHRLRSTWCRGCW